MIVIDNKGFWTDFCARGRLYGKVLASLLTRLMLTHHLRWSALCLNLTHVYKWLMFYSLTNLTAESNNQNAPRIEWLWSKIKAELNSMCVWHAPPLCGAYLRTSCQSLQYQMIRQYQMAQVSMMTRSQDRWLEYRNIFTMLQLLCSIRESV